MISCLLLATAVLLIIPGPTSISSLLGLTSCNASDASGQRPERRVALIDPLASESPDMNFVRRVTSLVGMLGYDLDYFPSSVATMDLFVNLPSKGYAMIILRSHIGWYGNITYTEVAVTTSERYSQYSRVLDQLSGAVVPVQINGTRYFGMRPSFVAHEMCGRFPGTLVLSMGCSSMTRNDLAEAFVERGARAFVGWNGPVSASYTDVVFAELVQLLVEGNPLTSVLRTVMNDQWLSGGPQLIVYPEIAGTSSFSAH